MSDVSSDTLSSIETVLEEQHLYRIDDENYPIMMETTKGRPLIVHEDRSFTSNKRRHCNADAENIDTLYMVRNNFDHT
jgi:hypothetical protein